MKEAPGMVGADMDKDRPEAVKKRAGELFDSRLDEATRRTSRMFAGLMVVQWLMGIVFALWISPLTWTGSTSRTHQHVYAATFLGAIIISLPVYLALLRPTWALTRHLIAAGQMLSSALLIHLTGGRIETHFHIFGSLAFLAFYRDWRVLLTATAIVALDHGVRGAYWPQSVYGVLMIQPLRFLEHSGWVIFTDVFLIRSILQGLEEMRDIADGQARLETVNLVVEVKVHERTAQLTEATAALLESGRRLHQLERLSAVGQLAAGVAHEINNPLGVILGFAQSALKRLTDPDPLALPLKSIERESLRCKNLVQNLLVFSRQSGRALETFDLDEAVESALTMAEAQARINSIEIVRKLGAPGPFLSNKGQLQQVVINLCSNAIDAMPKGGILSVRTSRGRWHDREEAVLEVQDGGCGIPQDILGKIFNPFFTTKEVGKGTGLGLSLVHEIVQSHGGTIEVKSAVGEGTTFTVIIPAQNGKEPAEVASHDAVHAR